MKTSFLKSLQSMRFFAALGVVQYHLWQNYFGITIGQPGTDFFLVLVGVVAAYTQAQQISTGNAGRYISARYRRLYVTFVPLFVITLLAKWHEADSSWALKSFFFIPIADRLPVIGSTWMLSMFLLFYFVFSLCFLVKTEKMLLVLFFIWAVFISLYHFWGWKPGLSKEWSNLFFAERNFDFMLGYFVGVVLRAGWMQTPQARIALWAGLISTLAGTILLNVRTITTTRVLTVGIPVAVFILGLAVLEQNKVNNPIVRALSAPWLVWLGGTSYVLYLSHGVFFQVWSRILPVTVVSTLPMTIGAIAVAALGYILWERPVLMYLKTGKWILPHLPDGNVMKRKVQRPKVIS